MRSGLRFFSQNRSLSKAFLIPPDHDYFRHTSNTWLFNVQGQYSNRYIEFNVPALIDEAIRAAKASSCIEFSKFAEGTSNRLFEIKLDNGRVLIAKLPYPIAGPAHFTTASEVATMQFMREMLELPVPSVLAWSSHAERTPVESEFIIMEKMEGKHLDDVWEDLSKAETVEILKEIVEIERRMTETHFHTLGSLYYAKDIPDGVRSVPMTAYGVENELLPLKGYCIGPSVDRRFWRGRRWELDIERGPWTRIVDYTQSVIDCEIAWLKTYAKPHLRESPLFRSEEENDPERHIELLNKYALVARFLEPKEFNSFRLWHPDLHGANILVSPIDEQHRITGILDWQGACIDLLLISGTVPDCLNPSSKYIPRPEHGVKSPVPVLPDDYDSLPKSKQVEIEKEWKAAKRYRSYTALTEALNPPLHAHRTFDMSFLCTHSLYWASRTWDEGLTFLENSLITICNTWDPTISARSPCPISFSESDKVANEKAMALMLQEQEVEELVSEIGIQPDGVVQEDELEGARRLMEVVREKYTQNLPESECKDARRRWPFQDGALSLTAEPCRSPV